MTPEVIQTQGLPNYALLVTFADGEQRRFCMRPYLKYPAHQALVEPHKFAQAHVANGAVVWDEDIDMSPNTLYLIGETTGERTVGAHAEHHRMPARLADDAGARRAGEPENLTTLTVPASGQGQNKS